MALIPSSIVRIYFSGIGNSRLVVVCKVNSTRRNCRKHNLIQTHTVTASSLFAMLTTILEHYIKRIKIYATA
jgi:hypothetical protein